MKLREKKSMMDLLMILATTLLAECGAVPHFCETSMCAHILGNSGRITSFDMDKDGQADYWQRFDRTGRKVELSFSKQSS